MRIASGGGNVKDMNIPALFLTLLNSAGTPMDTGAVVQGCRVASGSDTALDLAVWNSSPRNLSTLQLRLYLQGAPGSMDDLGWGSSAADKIATDGTVSSSPGLLSWTTAPRLVRSQCTGDTCAHQVVLDLPADLVLATLEGFHIELIPTRVSGGSLQWTAPSRIPNRSDWSLSNLSKTTDCSARASNGRADRATRIELLSQGVRVWGNAPGESSERPVWPSFDLRSSSFGSISRVLPDSVPTSVRDDRNMVPGRWLVNQAGYRLSDVKAGRARVRGAGVSDWTVIDSTGQVQGTGSAAALGFQIRGRVRTVEYDGSINLIRDSTGPVREGAATELVLPSNLPAGGPYRIASSADTSAPFRVDEDLYGMTRDATLKFLGIQRSGTSSSWFRGPSFTQDPVPGGWYDCGDHLKEGATIGYAMEVLGSLAATHPELDPDRTSVLQNGDAADGVPDLVAELRHGAEYALASWELSAGSPADMVVNVGDERDHQAWTHDFWTGFLPASKGGPDARVGRKGMGGNTAGAWAAGLAFSARLAGTDSAFSRRALAAARSIYAWGKANPSPKGDTWYITVESTADLALAAVALLWATHDTSYLHDLFSNDSIAAAKSLGSRGVVGGWLGQSSKPWALGKSGWMMDYDNPHTLALHALFKLVLSDPDTAARYGVRPADFDSLRSVVFHGALRNAQAGSNGNRSIAFESGSVLVDSAWGFPYMGIDWGFDRYLSGYLAELELYVDMAREVQRRPTVRYPSGTVLLPDSLETAVVRGMDYMLGSNPWDISFLMGVGSKNISHVHHRTANPDGANVPAARWSHRTPVGALAGGARPDSATLSDSWSIYNNTEACLDVATTFLVPATLLAAPAPSDPTGLRGGPRRSLVPAPRVSWDPRTGRLGWSGAAGDFRWEVLDGRGRILSNGGSNDGAGARSLDLPTGIAVLRWRSGERSGNLQLLRLPR